MNPTISTSLCKGYRIRRQSNHCRNGNSAFSGGSRSTVPSSDGLLGIFLFLASVIAGFSLLGGIGSLLGVAAGLYLASEVTS